MYERAAPSRSPDHFTTAVYRSRAAAPFTGKALCALAESARRNNASASITSLLAHGEGRFLQWLEGPHEAVDALLTRIQKDDRHQEFQLLSKSRQPLRRFPLWPLQLAVPVHDAGFGASGAVAATDTWVKLLTAEDAEIAPLLRRLAQDVPSDAPTGAATNVPGASSSDQVRRFVFEEVLPRLAERVLNGPRITHPVYREEAHRLAEAALRRGRIAANGPGDDGLWAFAETTEAIITLFEAAARRLGEHWLSDEIDASELATGLARLQTALHRQMRAMNSIAKPHRSGKRLLVAAHPAERPALGASLDAEYLRSQGWSPELFYPHSDEQLNGFLSEQWVDILDLSTGPVFTAARDAGEISRTIDAARSHSCNPELLIIASGTFFENEAVTRESVHADATAAHSWELNKALSKARRRLQTFR